MAFNAQLIQNNTSLNGLIMPPVLQNMPPKLFPMVDQFDDFRYFLLEGGRNGAKSQTVGRFLLWLGESYELNIVCGREVQNKIEESVYTLLVEIINEYKMPYKILSNEIRHVSNGTTFSFRGFQELSSEDIKGLQGVDILWVDEAQSLKMRTVKALFPTIRKDTAKMIFTMNRFLVCDTIYDELIGRPDCLHIYITYLDNPLCPLSQKIEADVCKAKSTNEYNHIWMGMPLPGAEDYLFDSDKLYKSFDIVPAGDLVAGQRIMSVDFAAQGSDNCVATILDRVTNQHWKITARIVWNEPDTMISTGRIINLIGQYKADVNILDVGGMGHVVWNRLNEVLANTGITVERFDGASTQGIDTTAYGNTRAAAYYTVRDWFENGFICVERKDEIVIKELEKIRIKYRSNGQRLIQSKADMRKDNLASPDNADSLMMGVWAAVTFLGKNAATGVRASQIKRVSSSRR